MRCCSTNGSAAAARTTRSWWCCAVPGRDVAFVGGIDLCHGRRDDAGHLGDPQSAADGRGVRRPPAVARRPARDPRPGRGRARHHLPAALDRPAFRRHRQPAVLAERPAAPRRHQPRPAAPRSRRHPTPVGSCAVQVLRTYPAIRPRTPYAPHGERTVARGFVKALRRARRLVYLEDQYLWSPHIARVLAAALRAEPDLHLVVVVPRHPDVDGRFALPPNEVGRVQAITTCRDAAPGPGARVRPRERARHAGVRARQGRGGRRRVGRAWAARTSTGGRGATTVS